MKKLYTILSVILLASMVLTACGTTPTANVDVQLKNGDTTVIKSISAAVSFDTVKITSENGKPVISIDGNDPIPGINLDKGDFHIATGIFVTKLRPDQNLITISFDPGLWEVQK